MRVGDFLSDDLGMNGFSAEGFLLRERDFAGDFEIRSGFEDVPDPAVMLLWDNERVTRGEWTDVEESKEISVFVDFVRRDLARDYLAENAIWHT